MARYEWLAILSDCAQDPVWHGEGDVLTHTRMVCDSLVNQDTWQNLSPTWRSVCFAAALLHDNAKPQCSRTDSEGRIVAPGHSSKGAAFTRRLLMGAEDPDLDIAPFPVREQVAALVRAIGAPLHAVSSHDPDRIIIQSSWRARCDHLALLARSDVLGRVCPDQERLLLAIDLFLDRARELHCHHEAYHFTSDHVRFRYFRTRHIHPSAVLHDTTRSRVTILIGLPGAGKDYWVARNAGGVAVISLDQIRERLGVHPTDRQAPVIESAREQAREYLRKGAPFIWNGTNISRHLRTQVIDLCARYDAEVTLVHVDADWPTLQRRNRERQRSVPSAVLDRLAWKFEGPDPTEAHHLVWV